jgi:hypothetical protein
MKKLLLVLMILAAPAINAQTRVLIGGTGGSSFGNLFIGPTARLEIPFGSSSTNNTYKYSRFELDLQDDFAPLEEHIKLGSGWANTAQAGGILWLNNKIGLNGRADYSNYSVSISKGQYFAFGGLSYRSADRFQMPYRLTFDYIREFNNGISKNGTESSQLQGGDFTLDFRLGCARLFCYRTMFNFEVGAVKTQGNPTCDGAFGGAVTCPRALATGAAFNISVLLEFPRRKKFDNLPF